MRQLKTDLIIDSDVSAHMKYTTRSAFCNDSLGTAGIVKMSNPSTAEVVAQGDITLKVIVDGTINCCTLTDVFHNPTLDYQLRSVLKIHKLGFETCFN